MSSRRRIKTSGAELIFGLVGVGFMMLVMFCYLPGGGGAQAVAALQALLFWGVICVFVIGAIGIAVWVCVVKSRRPHALDSSQATTTVAPIAKAYEAQAAFLSPAERSFFGVLQQSVSSNYLVFPKVRLADLVRPTNNPSHSAWRAAMNRTTGKHVDFVLCDPTRVNVVAAIELDDKSHATLEAGFRDGFVDSALSDAGIPILRVPATESYSPSQLRQQIDSLFGKSLKTSQKI